MSDIQTQLSNVNEAFDSAFNGQQIDKIAALYADNATVLPAPAGSPVKGTAAIEQFFSGLITAGVIDHHLELVEAVEDSHLAYQTGRWSGAMMDAEGARQTFGGNVQLIYRKQNDGAWKVVSHIWN
ncbi:MAG: nuclear transport factor 2 family protein [Methylophilaceae bacterium]|nr:nuclear transport factor 2 family protein [Methylophilaceae bacterium]